MTAEEYIKKALTKQGKKRGIAPKGNYGSKKKAKDKAQSIKDGLEMGWWSSMIYDYKFNNRYR